MKRVELEYCAWNHYGLGRVAHYVEQKARSEEHTSELQSRLHLVCRLLLEKKKNTNVQMMAGWIMCPVDRRVLARERLLEVVYGLAGTCQRLYLSAASVRAWALHTQASCPH